MKKTLLALSLLFALVQTVYADDHHHRGGYYDRGYYHGHDHGYWRWDSGRWVWMIPAIIGGVVVYEATHDPEPVIVQTPPPVVVQQPAPVVVQPAPQTGTVVQPAPQSGSVVEKQNCSPWTEVQNKDGTVTRTRTCSQ